MADLTSIFGGDTSGNEAWAAETSQDVGSQDSGMIAGDGDSGGGVDNEPVVEPPIASGSPFSDDLAAG